MSYILFVQDEPEHDAVICAMAAEATLNTPPSSLVKLSEDHFRRCWSQRAASRRLAWSFTEQSTKQQRQRSLSTTIHPTADSDTSCTKIIISTTRRRHRARTTHHGVRLRSRIVRYEASTEPTYPY